MFMRVKTTPNSPRKSVQLVESFRVGDKVRQKIVKHIGIAFDDKELEELKVLGESIKRKLELENTLPLFTPEEIDKEIDKAKKRAEKESYSDKDYIVNIKDLIEEDRVITGIHDVYGKLFDELNIKETTAQPNKPNPCLKNIIFKKYFETASDFV